MKNLIRLSLFAFLVLHLSSCDGGGPNTPPEKMLDHKVEGFTVSYPESWSVDTAKAEDVVFNILSPRRDIGDRYLESVSLVTQDVSSKGWNLDSFVVSMEGYLPEVIGELKMEVNERKEAGGKAYHRLLYSGIFANKDIKHEQRYWVEDGIALNLSFSAGTEDYDWYREDAERIMDSFKF